jgi:hypothetical protein
MNVSHVHCLLTAQPTLVVSFHTIWLKWPAKMDQPGLLKWYEWTWLYQASMVSVKERKPLQQQ